MSDVSNSIGYDAVAFVLVCYCHYRRPVHLLDSAWVLIVVVTFAVSYKNSKRRCCSSGAAAPSLFFLPLLIHAELGRQICNYLLLCLPWPVCCPCCHRRRCGSRRCSAEPRFDKAKFICISRNVLALHPSRFMDARASRLSNYRQAA